MHRLLFFYLLLIEFSGMAQPWDAKKYPKNYFQWPVKAEVGIVANFGELRNNHYHMGLDCRTEQKVNMPILAAADGYVTRIHIDATGFGRAIYINHPNGLTTLYAHLNDFYPELEAFTKAEQYKQKQWKISIDIPKGKFPVNKGQFIAYSGNTGGSQGPHLHFEIRDTKTEKVLNPLYFGFDLPDNIPPDITRLAIYDRHFSTYEQSPRMIPVKKNKEGYYIAQPIKTTSDKISFGITAVDRLSGSANPNGICATQLYLDNQLISRFEMDSISYDETRYLNAHIDFKTKASGGPYLQHLSPLPGYKKGIYEMSNNEDGITLLKDEEKHSIRIEVIDAQQNTTILEFFVQKENQKETNRSWFRRRLFLPGQINVFENDSVWLYMPEHTIYDAFQFSTSTYKLGNRTIYKIGSHRIPVHDYFPVRLKASFAKADTGKIVMKVQAGEKTRYKKARWNNGWYEASFRDFGDYELICDKQAPEIKPLWGFRDGARTSQLSRIAFLVTDNCKIIESFTALLDGKWILFTNDKEGAFVYAFDEHCPPGEHLLEVIVKDLAGNVTRRSYTFTH